MAANIRFFIENNLQRATITSSGVLSGYPAAWAVHPSPSQVARLDSGTTGYIDFDLSAYPAKQYSNGIIIVNHNLTAAGSFELRAGSTSGGYDILQETFDAHEEIWGWGDFPWADWVGWGGYMTPELIKEHFPYILRPYYFDGVSAAHWRLIATEPAATGLTYIEIGVVMLSEIYEPTYNIVYGFKRDPIQLSTHSTVSGGNTIVNLSNKKRRFGMSFARINDSEVNWQFQRMTHIIGNTRPVAIDAFSDTEDNAKRVHNRCYGYLQDISGISFDSIGIMKPTKELVIEDEL